MNRKTYLSILQYNTMRSKNKVMVNMLRDKKIMDFGITVIQEPWKNDYLNTTYHSCGQHFYLLLESPSPRHVT